MADAAVQAEAKRLWDLAHGAYEAIQKAVAGAAPEALVEQLKADWKKKHSEWWNFVHKKVLGKPGIVFGTVDFAGRDPLDDL